MNKKNLAKILAVTCVFAVMAGCGVAPQKNTSNTSSEISQESSIDSSDTSDVQDSSGLEMPEIEPYNPGEIDFNVESYSIPSTFYMNSDFVVGSNTTDFESSTIQELKDIGFTTDVDTNRELASCEVSEEFSLYYNGVEVDVKVCNPFEKPRALGECIVSYCYVEDTTGTIMKLEEPCVIGKTLYDELEKIYPDKPYKRTENQIIYKFSEMFALTRFAGLNDTLLLEKENEREMIFEFENNVLSAIRVEIPSYLYNGLQDNVAREELENLGPEQMQKVMQVRDFVMNKLEIEFERINIDLIHSLTGEIVLENDVLFAVDEYELSDKGKAYLDDFVGTYISVLTEDDVVDKLDSVVFEGHTDSTGDFDYNMTLSQKRAEAVLNYCLTSDKIQLSDQQKERFESLAKSIGFSCTDLVYTEDGEEDKDASRRVAIKFYVEVQ